MILLERASINAKQKIHVPEEMERFAFLKMDFTSVSAQDQDKILKRS